MFFEVTEIVFLSFLLQRFVRMAALMEEGVWPPTNVCVPTASPGLSVREVRSATLTSYITQSVYSTFTTYNCGSGFQSVLCAASVKI